MSFEPLTEGQEVVARHRPAPKRTVRQWLFLGFGIAVAGAFAVLIVSVFLDARAALRKAVCRAHLNQISLALTMYTADYSDHMPPAHLWTDCLYPYTKSWDIFRCPGRPSAPGGFAFNRLLSNRPLAELNSETLSPAIYESSLGTRNASDELQTFITPHAGESWLIYSTGWIQRVSIAPSAAAGLRKPQSGSSAKSR